MFLDIIIILMMQPFYRQLSYCGICEIRSWSDQYFSYRESNTYSREFEFKIWIIFNSYTVYEMGPW